MRWEWYIIRNSWYLVIIFTLDFFLGGYDNFPKLFESLCLLTIKQRNENRQGHLKKKKKKETLSIVCGFDFDRTLAPNP